jgi:hypothetical protein
MFQSYSSFAVADLLGTSSINILIVFSPSSSIDTFAMNFGSDSELSELDSTFNSSDAEGEDEDVYNTWPGPQLRAQAASQSTQPSPQTVVTEGSGRVPWHTFSLAPPPASSASKSFVSHGNEKPSLSGRSKVTLPSASTKAWKWHCENNDDEPKWCTLQPAITAQKPDTITVLVQLHPEHMSVTCALALPAWNKTDATNWADPEVLSAAFSVFSIAIDTLNPKACLEQRQKSRNTKVDGKWPYRAFNSLTSKLRDSKVTIGGRSYHVAYRKAVNLTNLQSGEYFPKISSVVDKSENSEHKLARTAAESLYNFVKDADEDFEKAAI